MKTHAMKLFALVLVLLMTATSAAAISPDALGEYGQISYNIYSTSKAPKIDGVVDAGEYGDALAVYNYGDAGTYWSGMEFDEKTLQDKVVPKNITFYLTYDAENLYLAVTCFDSSHMTPLTGAEVWDGDYLEFDIALAQEDFATTYDQRARFALGVPNEGAYFGYYAKIPEYADNGYDLTEQVDPSTNYVFRDGNLTTYEASFTWAELLGTSGAPEKALSYFQLGCSHEELAENSEYAAYLGVFRCAALLSDEDKAAVEAAGGTGSIAYNVLNFVGEKPVETEAPATAAPADSGAAAAPATPAAPATADMGIAAAAAVLAIAAGVVITAKKK